MSDRPVNFAEAIKATGCLVCGKPIQDWEPTALGCLEKGATAVKVHKYCSPDGYKPRRVMAEDIKVLVDPKVGDLAKLKSGGPLMTIESIEGDKAKCVWFSEYTVERVTLPLCTLAGAG